jgi:hypothetical protein
MKPGGLRKGMSLAVRRLAFENGCGWIVVVF